MQQNIEISLQSALFAGIDPSLREGLLSCLSAQTRRYAKGQTIIALGDRFEKIGTVLSGSVRIEKLSEEGRRLILSSAGVGSIFGEALACANVQESPVGVVANEETWVLLIPVSRLLSPCANVCDQHGQLIRNTVQILARKTLFLQDRLEVITQRTTRQKVLAYLTAQGGGKQGTIEIPLDREGMADYLCVERSALSHELACMQRDGLIRFRKNSFTLLGDKKTIDKTV